VDAVTIEKGQGYNDGSKNFAEDKIIAQCAAVKAVDPSICTVGIFVCDAYHL
jgi:hypothetical protein